MIIILRMPMAMVMVMAVITIATVMEVKMEMAPKMAMKDEYGEEYTSWKTLASDSVAVVDLICDKTSCKSGRRDAKYSMDSWTRTETVEKAADVSPVT